MCESNREKLYFTFFFLFFVDCTGLFSIVCSVQKLEKKETFLLVLYICVLLYIWVKTLYSYYILQQEKAYNNTEHEKA